jgi:hypothetical protein
MKELALLTRPAGMTTLLPGSVASLAVGTVQWPGQPPRRYLAGRLILTPSQRADLEQQQAALQDALSAQGAAGMKARGILLTKLTMAYPSSGGSERGAEARAEAYGAALDDLAPWALAEAIRKWHRGELGDQNYNFAPSPATLRAVTLGILAEYQNALDKVQAFLQAVPLERAMDPAPIEPTPRLRMVR